MPKGIQGFVPKTDHPLGWSDKEIAWLLSTGMNVTNIYRAMGYKGKVVTGAFKQRVKLIKQRQL